MGKSLLAVVGAVSPFVHLFEIDDEVRVVIEFRSLAPNSIRGREPLGGNTEVRKEMRLCALQYLDKIEIEQDLEN